MKHLILLLTLIVQLSPRGLAAPVYVEDFETGPGSYTHSGTNDEWEWGPPTYSSGPPAAHSGASCWGTDLDATYANNSAQVLLSPNIAVTGNGPFTVSCYVWHNTQDNFDIVTWSYSTNGGADWNELWFASGSSASWIQLSQQVPGVPANIRLRWRLSSNSSVTAAGLYIDDVRIEDSDATPTPAPTCPAGYEPAVLLRESFETWPPAGWTIVNNGGSCAWRAGSAEHDTVDDNFTGGSGDYADADSDDCGDGNTMDTELRAPPVNLQNVTNPVLTFRSDMRWYSYELDEFWEVDLSEDGGQSWTNLLHRDGQDYRGPETISLSLASAIGSGDAVIRFHYGNAQYDWWWQVDDVAVSCCQPAGPTPAPTATPQPTVTPSHTPEPTSTPDCARSGDVNGNGVVTPEDAQLSFFYYIDCPAFAPTFAQYCAADFCGSGRAASCDGSVTPADALGIMKVYLQLDDPCAKGI